MKLNVLDARSLDHNEMKRSYITSVFYEDTDCMGIVYHASYVRFLERGRTELLDSLGPNAAQWMERDVMFPIYRVDVTFRAPARLRDNVEVLSEVRSESPYRLVFKQSVLGQTDGKLMVNGSAEVVCTNRRGELREFPVEILARLNTAFSSEDLHPIQRQTSL